MFSVLPLGFLWPFAVISLLLVRKPGWRPVVGWGQNPFLCVSMQRKLCSGASGPSSWSLGSLGRELQTWFLEIDHSYQL